MKFIVSYYYLFIMQVGFIAKRCFRKFVKLSCFVYYPLSYVLLDCYDISRINLLVFDFFIYFKYFICLGHYPVSTLLTFLLLCLSILLVCQVSLSGISIFHMSALIRLLLFRLWVSCLKSILFW